MKNLLSILISISLLAACAKEDGKSVSANIRKKTDPRIESVALQQIQWSGYQASSLDQNLRNDIFGVSLEQSGTQIILSYTIKRNGSCFRETLTTPAQMTLNRVAALASLDLGYGSGKIQCLDQGCGNVLASFNATNNSSQGTAYVILQKLNNDSNMWVPTISASPIFLNTNDSRAGEALCWQSNPSSNGQVIPVNPTNYNPTSYDPYMDNNYWF